MEADGDIVSDKEIGQVGVGSWFPIRKFIQLGDIH